MKNRTYFAGMGFVDKLRQSSKTYGVVLRYLFTGLLGYILSNTYMLSGIYPFGVAYCACMKNEYSISATTGSFLGYLFSFNPAHSMKYIAAVMIIASVRWIFHSGKLVQFNLLFAPLLSFGSLAATSLAVEFATGFTGYGVAMGLSEALLAAGSTYFLTRTLLVFQLGQGLLNSKKADTACIVVTLCIFICALSSLQLGQVSIGRVLAIGVVLLCAYIAGEAGGSLGGVTTGFAVVLSTAGQMHLFGIYALGGLLSGVFSALGRFGCAIAFILTSAVIQLGLYTGQADIAPLYEVMIASTLFMLIPKRGIAAIRTRVFRTSEGLGDKGMRSLLTAKMEDACVALKDIADTTQRVSKTLSSLSAGNITDVYHRAADKVCRRCSKSSSCWQESYSETLKAMEQLTPILRQKKEVEKNELPAFLKNTCIRQEQLLGEIGKAFHEFTSKEETYRKVSQVRSVVTDQFEGMSIMLQDFEGELSSIVSFDKKVTAKIGGYLEKMGYEAEQIHCYRDINGRVTVQMYVPSYKAARINTPETTRDLSEVCDVDLEKPEELNQGAKTRLTYTEKAEYEVIHAAAQKASGGGKLCGDSFLVFSDRQGRGHMLLSDGMGSGSVAAIDATMTVSLLHKLLDAGVGYDAALKMVNSALLVKSGEESLATIDITSVDLYSGKTSFYKCGAAPTYVKKGGKTGYVQSTSLPVGILNGVAFEKSTTVLHDGDLVVMVSDGVGGCDDEWVRQVVDAFIGEDIQALCDDILNRAVIKNDNGHRDDITVIAALIKRTN